MYPFNNRRRDNQSIIDPYMRALELRAYVDEINFKKEAREQQRLAWKQEMEDRQRSKALSDFQTTMALMSMGALPVKQGEAGMLEAGLAGRGTIKSPTGQQYSLPSPEQRQRRLIGEEITKKQAGLESDIATGRKLRIKVPKIGDMPSQDILVDSDQYPTVIKNIRDAQSGIERGQFISPTIKTDEKTGEMVFLAIDAQTRKPVEIPFQRKLTPKPEKLTDDDYKAQVLSNKDRSAERMRRVEEWMPWAFSRIGADPNTSDPELMEKARRLAEQTVDAAMKLELEQEIARARVAGRAATPNSTPTQSSKLYIGKKMKRASLQEAARRLGMSVQDFTREFIKGGGTVIPF